MVNELSRRKFLSSLLSKALAMATCVDLREKIKDIAVVFEALGKDK